MAGEGGGLFSLPNHVHSNTVTKSYGHFLLPVPSRVESRAISTSNRFACESCKVRADRPSASFIISLVAHFMSLIFPRMPHYTTTYRVAPALSHWSWWWLNALKLKKKREGLLAQTWNKASVFVYLMDERFSLRALEMSHWSHNLCSLHSLALTSPQLISYAHDFFIPDEKCISPPADLHASVRSKESAREGNLTKSAVEQ